MTGVFSTAYLAPISYYQSLLKSDKRILDTGEHMVKQSYRNRAIIYGANGKQNLIVPLSKMGNRKPVKDQKIDYSEDWQKNHVKSIESAYRSSPFYEYYVDGLFEIIMKNYRYLLDLNLACHDFICSEIEEKLDFQITDKYVEGEEGFTFYRDLIHPKKDSIIDETEYHQLFSDKLGFEKDLTIMDLIFLQGPNVVSYL